MKTQEQGNEIPLVFDCQGEHLVGIVHRPGNPGRYGVITVVAGGPQYRGGVGRGLVSMGRELCAQGISVMRFDHRGLGDSSGHFLGFEHLEQDLAAAIIAFRAEVPEVEKIVLWGGCDAASGIMMHACNLPEVASIMVGNPFVSSDETQAAVTRKHYLKRLGEGSFWRKLLRFDYDLLAYGKAALATVVSRLRPREKPAGPAAVNDGAQGSFQDRMLAGLSRFEGPVLYIMSGQSLLSKEFDELLARSAAWKTAYERAGLCRRIDLPDADQAFSSQDAKLRVNQAVCEWLQAL